MPISVVVDDREPSDLVGGFRVHPDVTTVEVRRLATGDVVVDNVAFERKSVDDYLGSALGRTGTDLESQVAPLRETYHWAYVLVEGTFADLEAAWQGVSDAAVRGSMASIISRFGVPVLPCGDQERLIDLAVRLATKHGDEPGVRPLPTGAVPDRNESVAKRMYACIDGIGPVTATALFEAFPTVEALVEADEGEVRAVEGVGPDRAKAIQAALRETE